MKRLLYALGAVALGCAAWSCDDDDDYVDYWTEYASYREANERWIAEQEKLTDEDGQPFYERLVPSWDKGSYILIQRPVRDRRQPPALPDINGNHQVPRLPL